MNKQRYLIARFTKDIRRKESRNVGIILWTRHRVAYRFLLSNEAVSLGANIQLYERWIRYWSEACESEKLDLGRKGTFVRESSDFVDALIASHRGNFHLYESGFVRELISKKDVDEVVERLFRDLVELRPSEIQHKSAAKVLARQC